jgi:hypothetical protein
MDRNTAGWKDRWIERQTNRKTYTDKDRWIERKKRSKERQMDRKLDG